MASENHAIISLILYCICLKLFPNLFFASPLIGVFNSIRYLYYVPFQFVEHKVKWIRRELRLLRALSEDVKGVLKSRAEIDMKASRLWDSKINQEMTELLNPTEAGWIARTDDLAFLAEIVFKWFEECNERRQFDKLYFLSHNHRALFDEMKRIEKKIKAHLAEISTVDICGTLERSRAHFQSLQDRLKFTSFKRLDRAAAALISSILEKENKNRHSVDGMEEKIQLIELQLSFLFAFFKDLEGLDFQSETEKAWVEEASEIIDEAQCAIETFIQGPVRRFLAFTNWMAPRHKLMEDINNGFFELLNRKERYCLKFIKRDPSKFVTRSPHQKEIQISNPTDVEGKKKYWFDLTQNNLTGEYQQVKTLCDQWEEMHRHLEAAKAIEGVDNSREVWKDQMEKTTKKAENTIDDYIQTTEEERKKEGTYILNSLFDTTTENFLEYSTIGFLFPGNSSISERTHAAKLSKEKEQMRKVNLVLEKTIKLYRIEIREESTSLVGLEEDIHELISRLITGEKPIVSVVGMRGIGKTTLAEKVYNHGAISTEFKIRHWVSLSQESFGNTLPNEDDKLIPRALDKLGKQNGGSWIEKLQYFLGEEKKLLVLDNISTKEVWDTLINAFPATNGSKIMVTTRHKSVASHADQSSTQPLLRLRTKEESWKLFTQMVHLPPEIPPESEEIIKAKVVERCGGLPIAIFRLGYHLIRKHVTKENFLRELESIEHYKTPWIEAVANEELTDQLMECLAYIRLFPRDYEIPARRVVASWVAEEIVKPTVEDVDNSLECVAEKCLADLINRYIIQVLERKLDGKIKTFSLTNALREDWLQSESSVQRLADKFDRRTEAYEIIHDEDYSRLQNYKDLVTFLSFDGREGNKPGEDIGNFLQKGIATRCFRLLKVLDLERVFRPKLLKSIGNLNDLKYLGLRWTYLEAIPSSIGNLTNLQTLVVKHTYIRELPASIWKLQKLRHLYLNQSYRSKLVQPSVAALKNLQTLWGVFVDEESPLNNGLNRLMNLRKLILAF